MEMFKLSQPDFDNSYVVKLLMENMDSRIAMKSKLQNIHTQTDLYYKWNQYDDSANKHLLHLIPACTQTGIVNNIIGDLDSSELIGMYENYFSREGKKIRSIYNAILAKSDRCPFCGNIGHSAQLDHYLPKRYYPQYSIYPKNLIPICRDCNEGFKKASYAKEEEEQWIHPYFDKEIFFNEQWISANYKATNLEDPFATVEYFVNPPNSWSSIDKNRAQKHFDNLGLAIRFSKEANNQLQTLIPQVIELKQILTYSQLIEFYVNTSNNRSVNHWERVMYQALCKYIEKLK